MIGPYLEKLYGRNGIAMIVDEGGGYAEQFGVGESWSTRLGARDEELGSF